MKATGGFALAAAMMVLALLSVLAIAATQSTTLETQISAHDRDARAALYVAESALEEARYYAARGWGKIESWAPGQVHVTTPTAGPNDFWGDNRYSGFVLVDATGGTYVIQDHTDTANPVLTLVTGDPSPGRFVVFRHIPGTADPLVSWDAGTQQLRVENLTWALGSEPDRWNGWLLWDDDSGRGFTVLDSDTSAAPDTVWLQLSGAPGAGPYRLALNPWVEALSAGQQPPGDGDVATTVWDRTFTDAGGDPAGRAEVEASRTAPGEYELHATGHLHNGHRAVSLRVIRAGLPDQRLGDWRVEGEL